MNFCFAISTGRKWAALLSLRQSSYTTFQAVLSSLALFQHVANQFLRNVKNEGFIKKQKSKRTAKNLIYMFYWESIILAVIT